MLLIILATALLVVAWIWCGPTVFGIIALFLLLALLVETVPEEEDENPSEEEVREWVQEEVRAALFKSLRKHKAKYIENALSAYQELYGKDEFYQNIWTKVYEEFYKDSGRS